MRGKAILKHNYVSPISPATLPTLNGSVPHIVMFWFRKSHTALRVCRRTPNYKPRGKCLLLLPKGEGWDEGVGNTQTLLRLPIFSNPLLLGSRKRVSPTYCDVLVQKIAHSTSRLPTTPNYKPRSKCLLLLPKGEGWDEGEGNTQTLLRLPIFPSHLIHLKRVSPTYCDVLVQKIAHSTSRLPHNAKL